MMVSASLTSNYLFQPRPGEIGRIAESIGEFLIPCEHGYTFSGYRDIGRLSVKNQVYLSKPAEKTALYENEQSFLSAVGGVFSLSENKPVDAVSGLSLPTRYTITQTTTKSIANHIPQILSKTNNGSVIFSICGEYNFDSKLFHGLIITGDLRDFNNGNF